MNQRKSTLIHFSWVIRFLTHEFFLLIIILLILFLLTACSESCEGVEKLVCKDEEPVPPTGPPCDGYLTRNNYCIDYVDTQKDIDKISGMNVINGNLHIIETNLTDLEFLSNITEIQGILEIRMNRKLTNISSIASISSVHSLKIHSNPMLENLNGLGNIKAIPGDFQIIYNESLQNMGGLNAGTSSANIEIMYNDFLMDLSALNELTMAMDLRIEMDLQNLNIFSNLTNVDNNLTIMSTQSEYLYGLENLQRVGQKLQLIGNGNLLGLNGLNPDVTYGSLTIRGNPKLASLITLNNNRNIKDILILDNKTLTDISGLYNVTVLNGTLHVKENPMLASLQEFSMLQTVSRLMIEQNNSLVTLGLDSLTDVTEKFRIWGNSKLCRTEIIAVRDRILTQTVNTYIDQNAGC